MPKMPPWKLPKGFARILESEDTWESDRWLPMVVTAMTGTEVDGREIPVAWQIEFEPSGDDFETANAKLETLKLERDGYGWGEYVRRNIHKINSGLARRLHLTDCETDACVIWVESEEDCRSILTAIWKMIFVE